MINYYKLLEISPGASVEVINAAYKVKVKQYHPDNYSGQEEKETAAEKLKLLNEARDILTNRAARKEYDNNRKEQDFAGEAEDGDILLTEVQSMVIAAKSEMEYLTLHQRIFDLNKTDQQKSSMHTILDKLTAERLERELTEVKEIGNYQKKVRDSKSGVAFAVIMGFIASAWFSYAFLVGLVLGFLCYLGSKEDREKLANAQRAEQRIIVYRQHGFQIW